MTDDSSNQALRERFELLQGAEHHKNALIEVGRQCTQGLRYLEHQWIALSALLSSYILDSCTRVVVELLHRLDTVTQQYQRERLDHARESHFNRDVQLRELQLQEELRRTKAIMERDPFILVLIDGDGMIFDEQLLQKGEQGGKEAAGLLWGSVRDYVTRRDPELPSDVKIVTRIYANSKGLGEVCYKAGLVDKPSMVDEFARGFTGSKQLFDYIDVGSGKDRADDKLTEIFKLHLYDCHCRQIIFGCSHDNGYARLLEELLADKPIIQRITLLEGVPFEKELAILKNTYDTTKFNTLFRTAKINVYHPQQQTPQTYYQPAAAIARTISNTNTSSLSPMASSWASTAMTVPAHVASPPPTPKPASSSLGIPRNRYGQRVDPILNYDKNEVNRVKKIHMCNVHYLRGDCPYGDDCSHDHGYKPTKNEFTTLKYVARMTPC
ncbi:MAG: hypothetical protein M1830_002884, partial [Pleopsidium flavum]